MNVVTTKESILRNVGDRTSEASVRPALDTGSTADSDDKSVNYPLLPMRPCECCGQVFTTNADPAGHSAPMNIKGARSERHHATSIAPPASTANPPPCSIATGR
jgi:hypothetical protein